MSNKFVPLGRIKFKIETLKAGVFANGAPATLVIDNSKVRACEYVLLGRTYYQAQAEFEKLRDWCESNKYQLEINQTAPEDTTHLTITRA